LYPQIRILLSKCYDNLIQQHSDVYNQGIWDVVSWPQNNPGLFAREDVGAKIFLNVDNSTLIDTESHQTRFESSATTLWGRHAVFFFLNADFSLLTQYLPSRKLRPTSVSTHVRIQFTFGHLCVSRHWSSVDILTAKRWNLIGHCMTSPLPVLSPSSILLPHSSHCSFISARKDSGCVWKMLLFKFFYVFKTA
jgi:hypothetical protein